MDGKHRAFGTSVGDSGLHVGAGMLDTLEVVASQLPPAKMENTVF